MSTAGRLTFLAVVLAVLLLMHRYAWVRLVRDTGVPRRARRVLLAVFAALYLSLPATFISLRGVLFEQPRWLPLVAFVWLGLLFNVMVLCLALDMARLAAWLTRRWRRWRAAPVPPASGAAPWPPAPAAVEPALALSRRELLTRASAGLVVAGAGGAGLAGFRAAGELTVPEVHVRLARLPRALDGLCVVQLSDLHLGLLLDGRFLRDVVEQANAQKPDLVVITGDLVDGPVQALGPELAALSRLRSRWGTFFITGNHEYYSGADEWVAWLRARGVRVLLNERTQVGDAGGLLDVAGVTDWRSGHGLPGHAPDLARALAGRDPERELLLLAHQPKHVDEAAAHDVGLQLSGHTHGGQMWPFGGLVHFVQPYVAGLHRHGARTQVYVSRGTGFWGPPMRLAAPAEVTRVILTT
jgi:predicted MPP superfamily phosphohydrolase